MALHDRLVLAPGPGGFCWQNSVLSLCCPPGSLRQLPALCLPSTWRGGSAVLLVSLEAPGWKLRPSAAHRRCNHPCGRVSRRGRRCCSSPYKLCLLGSHWHRSWVSSWCPCQLPWWLYPAFSLLLSPLPMWQKTRSETVANLHTIKPLFVLFSPTAAENQHR